MSFNPLKHDFQLSRKRLTSNDSGKPVKEKQQSSQLSQGVKQTLYLESQELCFGCFRGFLQFMGGSRLQSSASRAQSHSRVYSILEFKDLNVYYNGKI